tara:strand:- start:1036 stop:1254 length:219 start_codon:yes stop_codon:yes gene_type:complete
MIPELVGAIGVVVAAIVTGLFHRLRRENNEAHGRAMAQLDHIASTVEHIDSQVDEIAEWQVSHEALHAASDQ